MSSTNLFSSSRASQKGVALVMVLGMLVLLSALLVAFMTTATNERTATQSASDSMTSRQLADTTVNLMIGQIRDATSSLKPDGSVNDKLTWASQPGAIRTFSGQLSGTKQYPAGGGSYPTYGPGSDDYVYKLYSAPQLKVTSAAYNSQDLPNEVSIIENWDRTKPADGYVDLNEPILTPRFDIDRDGKTVDPHYPIIDPRARFALSDRLSDDPKNAVVEGFDAKISLDDDFTLADIKNKSSSGQKVPYVPMPVKWMYVFRDGSIGDVTEATENNPIVGRTAFWTDDESCKLNINSSSEGTFWDTPTTANFQEAGQIADNTGNISYNQPLLSFGSSQPVTGEFQRYPGHPLTTCLSPVLGWLWGLKPTDSIYPANTQYRDFKEAIYQISPFLPYGFPTTKGGTWNSDFDATQNKQWYLSVPNQVPGAPPDQVPIPGIKTKHLYATVDELLFVPQRNTGGTDSTAVLNGKLTPQALERTRFFLTANSRAPELNLFGRPRVTIWPVNSNYDLRTHYDDLFAFTSTIHKDPGGDLDQDKRFHLTRSNAKDDREDFGKQNEDMYKYLQTMTGGVSGGGLPVPGFGGSFLGKYQADRNQILTEMFDYVRAVDLQDTGTASRAGNVYTPYTPTYFPKGIIQDYTRRARSIDWAGQVTPLKVADGSPEGTMGMGRFIVCSEAALVFHRVGTAAAPAIEAVLCLEMSTTMGGFPGIRDTYWTRVRPNPADTGRDLQIIMGTSPAVDAEFCTQGNRAGLVNIVNVSNHEVTDGRSYMPILGFTNSMHYFPEHRGPTDPTNPKFLNDPNKDSNRIQAWSLTGDDKIPRKNFVYPVPATNYSGSYRRNVTVAYYPYISKPIPIGSSTSFKFNGPSLILEIYTGESPSENNGDPRSRLVQTVELDFPSVTTNIPVPSGSPQLFNLRFDGSYGGSRDCIYTTDVVRSIEFVGPGTVLNQRGDLRMGAALQNIPRTYYEPRGGTARYATIYNSANQRVHGLQSGHGDSMPNDKVGQADGVFVAGSPIRASKLPILPLSVAGVRRSDNGPGDWDRGVSKHLDGALSNKVDEGNLKFDYGESNAVYKIPYFRGRGLEETGQSFFSPNRQLPSAVMFGSLPTGVKRKLPWQTLLFRPDRENGPGHPGGAKSGQPPDHLWLDLFTVPVVEPFAISEPFSTMGKVNMNYVIAPFGYAKGDTTGGANLPNMTMPRSYLRRDTAVRGVLKSTFMTMIRNGLGENGHSETLDSVQTRYPIDLDKTIQEFEARLNDTRTALNSRSMDLFRSASEICDIDLFPGSTGAPTVSSFATFWDSQFPVTGDNMRERPYAHIYPRLTTKSNVFTVYMRCQAIRKGRGSKPNEFDPKKDTVVSEYRGSSTVERFIDPNDPNLDAYNALTERVEPHYRFRIVNTKQFSPH